MPNDWNIESSIEDGMAYNAGTYPQVQPKIIGPGQSLSLNLTPLLGILQCGKYLPLRYMGGMTLEFTLADAAAALHPNSVSQSYNVEQASMRMATVRLDSALESSFSAMMLQGKKLPFNLRTLHVQEQALPASNTEVSVSLVRALSRLAGIFVTFIGPQTYVDAAGATQTTPATQRHLHKSFLNPSAAITGVPANAADEATMSWSLQIGPKTYPEGQPCGNLAETFSLLKQTIGTYDESIRTISIHDATYRDTSFVLGVPLQTVVGASFSSVNTRSGDLVVFTAKNLNQFAKQAGRVFVHMVAETIVEIGESGVQVYD